MRMHTGMDPVFLCRKHLLGEHGELHKHRPSFVKHHKITKRIALGQIEPLSMKERHDLLVAEMLRRNYNHNSPYDMPDLSYLPANEREFRQDPHLVRAWLIENCTDCAERIQRIET